MAEHVQAELDRMVVPLLDLQEREIFTPVEIKALLQKRREHEYKLRSRNPLKSDYLAYIRDEVQFERLRALRTKRQSKRQRRQQRHNDGDGENDNDDHQDEAKNKGKNKKKIGDAHFVQHLHRLWDRTLRRYRDDVELFLQYAEFCKAAKSFRMLSRLYARALQLHPRNARLWLEAASHEYFRNRSLRNARILLQRGIRTLSSSSTTTKPVAATKDERNGNGNSDSKDDGNGVEQLWIQSFALELHFVQKMAGRRKIAVGGGDDSNNSEKDESDAEDRNDDDNADDEDAEQQQQRQKQQQYALAKLVYDHAIRAVPDDVAFRFQFAEQCRMFPSTEDLQRHVLRTVRRDFTVDARGPEAWIGLARYRFRYGVAVVDSDETDRKISAAAADDDDDKVEPDRKRRRRSSKRRDDADDDSSSDEARASRSSNSGDGDGDNDRATDTVVQILREATRKIPSSKMYSEAIRFLGTCIDSAAGGSDDGGGSGSEEDDEERDAEDTEEEYASFLDTLFREVEDESTDLLTPDLVLEYADHLVRRRDDAEAAVKVLDRFLDGQRTATTDDYSLAAALWTRYAGLAYHAATDDGDGGSTEQGAGAAVRILQKGLDRTPIDEPGHLLLLIQLLGANLAARGDAVDESEAGYRGDRTSPSIKDDFVIRLLEKILILYPAFSEKQEVSDARHQRYVGAPFGIMSVPDACIACLRYVHSARGLNGARNVYRLVLFQSNCFVHAAKSSDIENLKLFIDEAVAVEEAAACTHERTNQHLLKLYDLAIRTFKGTIFVDEYRRRQNEYRSGLNINGFPSPSEIPHRGPCVPCYDASSPDFSPEAFLKSYQVYQVVGLRNIPTKVSKSAPGEIQEPIIAWKSISNVFQKLGAEDKKSWCVETDDNLRKGKKILPEEFLKPTKDSNARGYCSFLVQTDESSFETLTRRLPVSELLGASNWSYEPALWVFFGRNPRGSPDMEGRPEHTDAVSHDGTWHYQLSGKKRWHLRPTSALLRKLSQHLSPKEHSAWNEETSLCVDCNEGDIIVVNTKLWLHKTIIPAQKQPSVSYARDFCVGTRGMDKGTGGMTNLDGLYATNDIDEDTIVFKETDMPDCELHRSNNPNCEVLQLEDGSFAVVSIRKISSGEFFSVAESDDNDDAEDSESDDDCVGFSG